LLLLNEKPGQIKIQLYKHFDHSCTNILITRWAINLLPYSSPDRHTEPQ